MKLKHNKKRNTAFIFEVLVSEVSKASMHGAPTRKRTALNILKKYYKKMKNIKSSTFSAWSQHSKYEPLLPAIFDLNLTTSN